MTVYSMLLSAIGSAGHPRAPGSHLVELVAARQSTALELRGALQAQSLRAPEVHRGADLNLALLVHTALVGLGGSRGLGRRLGRSLRRSLRRGSGLSGRLGSCTDATRRCERTTRSQCTAAPAAAA